MRSVFVHTKYLLTLFCAWLAFSGIAGAVPEYWAGRNKDGDARNSSGVSLQGNLRVGWAVALTNFNECTVNQRANYGGQRGNNLAVQNGRILMLVPNETNYLSSASSSRFASFGTFDLRTGDKLHETVTTHLSGGTRGAASLQDSDTTYGLVNFYWNANDTVFTAYGSDSARSYAFDADTGTLPPGSPFTPVALAPNASGSFSMTYDNPQLYARGALNTHGSFSSGRAGILGTGESLINSMKHYAPFLVSGWDVFSFTMTDYTENASFPTGLGTVITDYRFTNDPYGVSTRWQLSNPSNTFAGFGLHHVRGAPRPIALGQDGRIYYYGFRNTLSGSTPVSADYASGMRLFAVDANNGSPQFEISTGWNPAGDAGLAGSSWGTQLYHHILPQIAVASNRVVVFHPQVNQGATTNIWTRGRLFCFDTVNTSLLWSVTYTNNSFNAKLRLDDVVYNPLNNTSPNSMWGDNTEQAVQMTIAGDSAYLVDPSIVGGAATGALQLTVYKYALANGAVTVTNLIPLDATSNTITAVAERMVNANDNTNRIALRELAAVDGRLVALIDTDARAQALVTIEGSTTPAAEYAPSAAIAAPFAGVPPALQSFNDSRLKDTAPAYGVPVLDRAGSPLLQIYETGTSVPFDASGSLDPDGGTLTYAWSFGDGQTGSGAQTTHTYASWGGTPAVSNMTIRLTVVDNESHTSSVARVIQVRDAGQSTVTSLVASADSYIWTAGSTNSNYGTSQTMEVRSVDAAGTTQEIAYLKFDLTGIDVSGITDAVLRVLVTVPKEFLLEAYAVSNDWTETGIKGTNAPALGDRQGDATATQYDSYGTYTRAFYQWLEFPVTAHVRDTSYGTERSFAVASTNASTTALILASRNNTSVPGSAPQLVLRLGAPAYTAPAVTSAPPLYIVYTNSTTQTLSVAASSSVDATNLTYNWVQVSGPQRAGITAKHTVGSGSTTVSIPSGGGKYVFRCLVDDGVQASAKTVTFQETAPASFSLSASANNPAWGSVSPQSGSYVTGEVAEVTATANSGYRFVSWSGDASGVQNPLSLTMDANKTITAVFDSSAPTTNTLTVVSLYGQAQPAVGVHTYTNGVIDCSITNTPLAVSVSTQVVCAGWSMAGNSPVSGVTTGLTVSLTNNAVLTWLWTTNVQFTASAAAGGSLTGSGSGWVALGDSISVTAVPDYGYAFAGWSGVPSGMENDNPLVLTLDQTRSVVASFTQLATVAVTNTLRVDFGLTTSAVESDGSWQQFGLSATSETKPSVRNFSLGSNTVSVTLTAANTLSARDRTTAIVDGGDRTYSDMYRDLATVNSGNITMTLGGLNTGATYTVRGWMYDYSYAGGNTFTITDTTDGRNTLFGTVTNATGTAGIPTNDLMYSVVGTAAPASDGTLILEFSGNTSARFNGIELIEVLQIPVEISSYTLTVAAGAGGAVSPTGGVYSAGSQVVLTATPDSYYHFTAWSGDVNGTNNPLTVSMTSDVSVAAGFAETLVTNSVPQAWLAQYGISTDDAGALSDTDGDGMAAWEEYIAGTLPNLGSSVLEISNGWKSASGFVLGWSTVTGRVYSVYWRSNLVSGVWSQLTAGASGSYTDTVHSADNDGFYRIYVEPAP